ncbi:MAG: hypothetical protein R3C68_10495 [Myxococcota bacterium]
MSKQWSITHAELVKALPDESAKDIALAFGLDSHGDKKHILEASDIRGVVKKLARSSNAPATIDRHHLSH